MAMVYMTWRGTFGNGVLIGMIAITMQNRPEETQQALVPGNIAYCAAGRGATVQTSCALRPGATTIRRSRPTTAFVVFLRTENYTLGIFA